MTHTPRLSHMLNACANALVFAGCSQEVPSQGAPLELTDEGIDAQPAQGPVIMSALGPACPCRAHTLLLLRACPQHDCQSLAGILPHE